MLKEEINESLKNAMKSKDEKLTSALRNIKTKVLELEKTEIGKVISDQEIYGILRKLAKERKQSIEMFEKGNRPDLVTAETYELSVIESYLPKQLSADEIEQQLKQLISDNNFSSIKDMGKVIKAFNEKFPGLADGKTLSDLVKNNLV